MNTDEHGLKSILIGAMLAAASLALPAHAATPVPSGKWSFVFKDTKGLADRPVRVYTYRPRQCDSTCPIQFVLHGASRTASNYRDYWELAADRYGFLVIAPEFNEKDWPKAASYNLGDVEGNANREKWAFSLIEHLFDEMRDGQKDYRIFGHSAGAQFVHRLLFLLPGNRASVAMIANAGWYTLPEWRADKAAFKWPHSLVNAPGGAGEKELREALARKVYVLLGEADTKTDDPLLDKAEGSMKQGANRFERGENFFGAVTGAANALGVKLAWELSYVPGVGHEGGKMSRAAADLVYGKKK
jgi:pimeloyl-ACP methyl ester carboxylesterase